MKTEMWLGITAIISSIIGFLIAIFPPNKRWQKAILAVSFVLFGIAGITLVVKQSKETATARNEAKQQIERSQKEAQQAEDQLRDLREANEANYMALQLIGKSCASPEQRKKIERIHRHFQRGISEPSAETKDTLNPRVAKPQSE
jgi:type III secretory pathway component EscV